MGPVPAGRTPLLALLVALVTPAPLSGCGGEDGPEETAMPAGLTAYVDQPRTLRQTRSFVVRLVNEPERFVTVLRAEVSSSRFGALTWAGEKTFQNEADLDLEMPRAECGEGSDARVRLTYRVDDGAERVSETTATDRYGAIGLFLDRDCAEETFAEAATLELGDTRVVGTGRESVLELPVTMVPTGNRDDVAFGGFEDTVLFRGAEGSPTVGTVEPAPLGPDDPPVDVVLRLVPTRCDPHALAEDKVGTLVGVRTLAPGLSEVASFHLPIGEERRGELRRFFASHCGL